MAQAPGHGIFDKQGGSKKGGRGGSGGSGGGGKPDYTMDLLAEYGDPMDPTIQDNGELPPQPPPADGEQKLAMGLAPPPEPPVDAIRKHRDEKMFETVPAQRGQPFVIERDDPNGVDMDSPVPGMWQEASLDLPDDAPGVDTVDQALVARAEEHEQGQDLKWLLETAPPPDTTDSAVGAAVTGLAELPRQALGGVRDAAQEILDLGTWLEEKVPLGGVQILDEEGNFAPKFVGPEELEKLKPPELPTVDPAKTTGGAVVRSVAQFLAPFSVISKAAKVKQAASGVEKFARAAGAGALTDFLAFDPHQKRLSNLLNEVPGLQKIVPDYLNADPSDGEIEGRLKNAIEGLGIGTLAEGLFAGIKATRAMYRSSRAGNTGDVTAEVLRTSTDEDIARNAADLNLLGSAKQGAPLVARGTKKIRQAGVEIRKTAETPQDAADWINTIKNITPLKGKEDVFVNFARINTPEDIQNIIKYTTTALKDDIVKAQRGEISNAQTVLNADQVNAWETLIKRRVGQPLNAEETFAARQLYTTAAEKLGYIAELAARQPSPERLFQFRRMFATFHAIQKEVLGARAETARALQQWTIPVGGSKEIMRDLGLLLDNGGGEEVAKNLAERVAQMLKMPNGHEALAHFAERGWMAKTGASIQEYWINAILSGPKTHIVNALSNASVQVLSLVENSLAARAGKLFKDETSIEIGEAAAEWGALRQHIWDAFRNAGKAFRTGQTGFGVNKIESMREQAISSEYWGVRSDSWVGRATDALGAVVNVPGRTLQASDELFKTLGYRMKLASLAHRQVTKEIKEGVTASSAYDDRFAHLVNNPPEAVRMEAVAEAAYRTFTSPPGDLTRAFHRFVGSVSGGKYIFPFVNTPANITKFFFERTPLAPLTRKFRNAMAKGGADAELAATRMALGTTALMFAVDMGLQGHVTGSGPSKADRSERQTKMRGGWRPRSVRIGDKFIAYNRLDPMGFTLGVGADIAEWLMNNDQPTEDDMAAATEGFAAGVFAIASNLFSKTYMKGMSLMVEAVNDPVGYGEIWMNQFAGSFVPTGVREIAQGMDPVKRQVTNMWEAMQSRVPGLSQGLPAQRDLWGREISYRSGLGTAYDVMSPMYGSTYKPEPIDKVMQRDGWYLGMGGDSIQINGQTVSLKNRADIKNRYYELRGATPLNAITSDKKMLDKYGASAGKNMLEMMNDTVQGKGPFGEAFKKAEDPIAREKVIRKIFTDYGRAARTQIIAEFPWITETAGKKLEHKLEGK